MAIYELRNDTVAIGLESLGAELKSLKRLDTGTEYMWRILRFGTGRRPFCFPL